MAKPCIEDGCNNPVWARKRCLQHDKIATPDKYSIKKKNVTTGLKTLQNKQPVRSSQIKNKRINPISDKQKENLALYRVVRDQYLKDNPICEFPNCSSKDVQLHHKNGRSGAMLTNVKYFSSLCHTHHQWCHLNDKEARELGLIGSRLAIL